MKKDNVSTLRPGDSARINWGDMDTGVRAIRRDNGSHQERSMATSGTRQTFGATLQHSKLHCCEVSMLLGGHFASDELYLSHANYHIEARADNLTSLPPVFVSLPQASGPM